MADMHMDDELKLLVVRSKLRPDMWPALWHAAKEMGGLGCGNGLRNADQCQIGCYRDLVPGYYALEGDHFVPGQTQQGGRTK